MMVGCCCAEACTAAVLCASWAVLSVVLGAWSVRCVRWADWVDCRCFLYFVFLGDARRLELSPCNTEKAAKDWHHQGRRKLNKTKNHPTGIPTVKPTPLTGQAPDSTAKSTHDSSRLTRISKATLHARQMRLASITQAHQGHRQSPLSQRNPERVAGGPSRITTHTHTHTPPATAGTSSIPLPGGLP